MITYQDIKCKDSTYECSLSALIGKKVVDVRGYIADELGGGLTWKLTSITFEDGTFLMVEGEHDFPYLVEGFVKQPNFDDETLERIYEEHNQ